MKIDAKVIKELRKDNGLRLSDVAARLHVSEATVSRYESGEIQRASPTIINAYSKLFRVPVTYICENLDSDWVEVLQKGRLADPRIAGFIEYLEEQAEKEINGPACELTNEEWELIAALRSADKRSRKLVYYALGIKPKEDEDQEENEEKK